MVLGRPDERAAALGHLAAAELVVPHPAADAIARLEHGHRVAGRPPASARRSARRSPAPTMTTSALGGGLLDLVRLRAWPCAGGPRPQRGRPARRPAAAVPATNRRQRAAPRSIGLLGYAFVRRATSTGCPPPGPAVLISGLGEPRVVRGLHPVPPGERRSAPCRRRCRRQRQPGVALPDVRAARGESPLASLISSPGREVGVAAVGRIARRLAVHDSLPTAETARR